VTVAPFPRHKQRMEIVLRSVQAAVASFDDTFQEHYPRVVAMLARLTGDRAQAEEIASDVFHKLARRPPLGENPAPWIYRVAANAGLDAARANLRRRQREREAGAEQVRTSNTGDALEAMLGQERRARVRTVLARLKPRDSQLLLLRASGMAYRELAEALGIQPCSVGKLLARAEAEFERRFRARYGDDV
jgi:RNA polymerase sigma-70 factor, ECF subfamily